MGMGQKDSQTISVILRPRTFMEITTEEEYRLVISLLCHTLVLGLLWNAHRCNDITVD